MEPATRDSVTLNKRTLFDQIKETKFNKTLLLKSLSLICTGMKVNNKQLILVPSSVIKYFFKKNVNLTSTKTYEVFL